MFIFSFPFAFTSVQMPQLWEEYVWPLQVLFKEIQCVQSPFFSQHEKFPVTKTLQQQELLVKDSLLFSLLRQDHYLKDLHVTVYFVQ